MDAALCDDFAYRWRELSVASFASDSPIYESQFLSERISESGSPSTGASSLDLDDCLVDFNCESFLNIFPSGGVVDYE